MCFSTRYPFCLPKGPYVSLFFRETWFGDHADKQTLRDKIVGTYVVGKYSRPIGVGQIHGPYNFPGVRLIFRQVTKPSEGEAQNDLTFRSPENITTAAWRPIDLVLGVSIPAFLYIFGYALLHFDAIIHRPWIAGPFYFVCWVASFLILLVFAIYVCKKRGFWPLVRPVPATELLKGLLSSFVIALLINIIAGYLVKLLSVAVKMEIIAPKAWQYAKYAPSSTTLVGILIFSFTLGPLVEEVFFRGFLYNALKTRVSLAIAATFQAALFSFWHRYDFLNSFYIFIVGLAFVIVYEKRKNLLAPIFVHGIMNALWAVPLLLLTLNNFHIPAANWDQAMIKPNWIMISPSKQIERQKDGMQQWQYAIDTWGSKGSRQWKKEMNAFNAVCVWFPEDRKACSKARLGMVDIYFYYLKDYRRAIIEADTVLSKYADQKEECAKALTVQGWSYYMLKDFQNSRKVFSKVLNEYKEYKRAFESAQLGFKWLDIVENTRLIVG